MAWLPARDMALEAGRTFSAKEETEPILPFVWVLCTPMGVVSSSVKFGFDIVPRTETLRGPIVRGPTLPFRVCPGSRLLGSPAVPRTL